MITRRLLETDCIPKVYSASVGDVVLLEEASCDAGDAGYVALHEPYGAVEHRLFAQAVYRPSLRRTC